MGLFGNNIFGNVLGDLLGSGGSGGGIVRNPTSDMKIMRDLIKENDDGPIGEIYRLIDDSKEEFYELITDGFVEMVIKGNSEYKTSFEIKNDADKIISQQAERYQDKCNHLNIKLNKLNDHITALYEKKIILAKCINAQLGYLQKVTTTVSYKDWMEPTFVRTHSSMAILCDTMGLESILSTNARKKDAIDHLENAKDFEVYVAGKIAEMNRVIVSIDAIDSLLSEEDNLLVALEKSISTQRNLEYDKIATQLEKLIIQYVLNDKGEKNESYFSALHQLEDACNHI